VIPVWSPEAINDLVALRAYIEQDDSTAAQRVALHIIHTIESLFPEQPRNGTTGPRPRGHANL
jgi:plasmid stabilization system protein ParE